MLNLHTAGKVWLTAVERSASELHRAAQRPYDMPTEGHKVAPNTGNEITERIVRVRLATGWTVQGSNPGGSEIFLTRPDRPWGPHSLLYIGYRVYFPGVKRQGPVVDYPPLSSAEVKERAELYLTSPLGLRGLLYGE